MAHPFLSLLISMLLVPLLLLQPVSAAPFKRLTTAPQSEQWFGIYVDNDRVGFYRQKITAVPEGYRITADGSVKMKIMGFSKEATTRENYLVSKTLSLRSLEVEQSINGVVSRVTGKVGDSTIRITSENNGASKEKQIKVKGEVFPGAALNILPLMRETTTGKTYKVAMFDPEEIKVKEVKISILGSATAPDGKTVLKLRNNLYPFVNNDILVDEQGETIMESVRDGLVTTRQEQPSQLGQFVGNLVLSKKDLIYDFSMVRVQPPLPEISKIRGLKLEISGWNDSLPLLQSSFQKIEKKVPGVVTVATGSALPVPVTSEPATASADTLQPAEGIESNNLQIVAKAAELIAGKQNTKERAAALSAWTADWLKDTVDDGGGAKESFASRSGNCQTHARLYTALARSVGIPTRFVSGLVYQNGLGFLYHSWAESLLDGIWTPVDPTYNQLPADPTHIKLFEGHRPEDLSPIIAIIGKIKITVLDVVQTPVPQPLAVSDKQAAP